MTITINVLTVLKFDRLRRIKLEEEHVFSYSSVLSVHNFIDAFLGAFWLLCVILARDEVSHLDDRDAIWEAKVSDDVYRVVVNQVLLLIEIACGARHDRVSEQD